MFSASNGPFFTYDTCGINLDLRKGGKPTVKEMEIGFDVFVLPVIHILHLEMIKMD